MDKVVSNNVVNGQVNWAQAARGSYNILKPGGKITIAPYAGDLAAQLADIESALRQAGFRNIVLDPIKKMFYTAFK